MKRVLPRQPIQFPNDRLAMYDTFSFSLDNMYIIKRDQSILNLDRERLVISQVREQSASCEARRPRVLWTALFHPV